MSKKEVIKHSAAIQITNEVNLLQRRAWNILLANAFDDLGIKDEFGIPIRRLCSILRYDSRNDKHLKQLLRDLVDIKVEWNVLHKDAVEWGIAVLLAQAQIINGVLIYGYAPILRKRLHNPEMYAKINLSLQNKFDSKHSLALYELFVDYFNYKTGIGETPYINIDDFRKLLGLKKDEYKIFGDLNKWVIKKAVKEINTKSDLFVQIEYKRDKRKIVSVKFNIEKHPINIIKVDDIMNQNAHGQTYLPLPEFEIENKELFDTLINEFGLSNNKAIEILKSQDEFYLYEVLDAVRMDLKEGNIRNLAAYTIRAIQEDYRKKETGKQKEKKEREEKKKRNEREIKIIDKLRMEYEVQWKKKIEELLDMLDENEKAKLLEEFLYEKIENNILLKGEYKEKGLSGQFVKAIYYEFVAEKYLSEENREFMSFAQKKGYELQKAEKGNYRIKNIEDHYSD
jgi:hypothetical protein